MVNGSQHYLGFFDTEEEAARIYDEKAKRVHVNPILNFLPDGSLNPDRKKRGRPTSASSSSGAIALVPPPRASGARCPMMSAPSLPSFRDAPAHRNSSGDRNDEDDEDTVTIAIKEEVLGDGERTEEES